jgi:signal transduction histidine kinase
MRLAAFILENMEDILEEWEIFARSIQPVGGEMSALELRDHAEAMLKVIALDLQTDQTEQQSKEKSLGNEPRVSARTAAQSHADERLGSGFSIDLLVSEYRALRASVLRLWLKNNMQRSEIDVGDMIRFNEAVDQALAESVENYAQLAVESQDIFLGILGHDLRSPLQSVSSGAAYLMRAQNADSRVIQVGARMYNSAMRMSDMLDDLLDYTKIRIGGGLRMSVEDTDLALVCGHVIEEFQASQPGRNIRNEVTGDCRGNWDGKRIGQVYQNLIGNALQYSAADGVIEVALQCSDDDEVVFCVHNEGVPIPEAEQRHMFDPLRRHKSNKPEEAFTRNLGLGLYIAREVVLAHHGTISLTSTEAKGTTFKVTLPKSTDKKAGKLIYRNKR